MNKRMRALIEHTATFMYAAVGIAALLVLCVPPTLQAQQTSVSRPPTARTRTVTVATGGRCSELTSSPTMLLQAPEGRALLPHLDPAVAESSHLLVCARRRRARAAPVPSGQYRGADEGARG